MKIKSLVIFFSLFIIGAHEVNSNNIEINRLNPSLRKEIDSGLLNKAEEGVNTDLNSKQAQVNELIGKSNEANQFADSIKNTPTDSYASEGMKARDNKHNEIVKSMLEHPNNEHLEEDDPVFAVYDEIAKDPGKYISKDCKEEIGKAEGPAWKELKVKQKIVHTEYEKNLCEHLQNQYSCRSTLQLRCKNPYYISSQGFKILNINGGIPSNYTNGIWSLGWGDTRVFDGGRGTIFDYSIDFSVDDIQTVTNFILESIGYDDLVLIKLNNNYVYSGPYGGDKLEPAPSPNPLSFFDFHYVNIGSQVVAMEQWHWRAYNPNINLKPLLKSGTNTLNIRLVVGGRGGLSIRMRVETKSCAEKDWVQSWEETCTHIAVP
jgi:hypothetical protein